MSALHEATVRECLKLFHSTGTPDLERVSRLFAENAVYQPLVPRGTPKKGRAAIVAELASQFGRYTECDCEILAIASSQRHVFTERRDHVQMRDGRKATSSVNAVFEFDADGRIADWREYWDAADIALLLGTTPEAIHRRMSEN